VDFDPELGVDNDDYAGFEWGGVRGWQVKERDLQGELKVGNWVVEGGGDFNGDGYNDLIVGYPDQSPMGRKSAGATYLLLGREDKSDLYLSNFTSGDEWGVKFIGAMAYDGLGVAASFVNDLNGDGLDDIVMVTNRNWAYVMYGRTSNFTDVDFSNYNSSNSHGYVISLKALDDYGGDLSFVVNGPGDVNGDGFADFTIGNHNQQYEDRVNAGAVYVVYGYNTTVLDSSVNIPDMYTNSTNSTNASVVNVVGIEVNITVIDISLDDFQTNPLSTLGFVIFGANANDHLGYSVGGGGDVNGDGLHDIVIGSLPPDVVGFAYVLFGKEEWTGVLDLLTFVPSSETGMYFVGKNLNERFAKMVSHAGDFNGDGFDDVLVGGKYVYMFFGGATVGGTYYEQAYTNSGTDNSVALVYVADVLGPNSFARYNFISNVGDINGDGFGDIGIHQTTSSFVYVFFGHAIPYSTTQAYINLAYVTNPLDAYFIMRTNAVESSFKAGGDYNNDGFDDIVLSDPWSDRSYPELDTNYAQVFYGGDGATMSPTLAPTPTATDPAPTAVPSTAGPTTLPTRKPSLHPTTLAPSVRPTAPTCIPTLLPTTLAPTVRPTAPTCNPTLLPTSTSTAPSAVPTPSTCTPTCLPTTTTVAPTTILGRRPTAKPTAVNVVSLRVAQVYQFF
jgi:hypothetical protein